MMLVFVVVVMMLVFVVVVMMLVLVVVVMMLVLIMVVVVIMIMMMVVAAAIGIIAFIIVGAIPLSSLCFSHQFLSQRMVCHGGENHIAG